MSEPTTNRSCEGCSLCCKVLRVEWMNKPANQWCVHSVPAGCGIHGSHPQKCRDFYCLWIDEVGFGEDWKPSVSRFVMTRTPSRLGLLLNVDVDTPDAWKREPYYSALKGFAEGVRAGAYVAVAVGAQVYVVFPEEDLAVCALDPGSRISVSYKTLPNGRQPYVAIQIADGTIREFHGGVYA